jgi:hypothetical protein
MFFFFVVASQADEKLKTTLEKSQPHGLEEIDCEVVKRCIQIGLICVNLQKTKRPTIKKILQMLDGLENIDCHYSNKVTSHADCIRIYMLTDPPWHLSTPQLIILMTFQLGNKT